MILACTRCGKEFSRPPSKSNKFCSRGCFNAYKRETSPGLRLCPMCGAKFITTHSPPQIHCSRECWKLSTYRKIQRNSCQWCGVVFISVTRKWEKANRTYCSKKCSGKAASKVGREARLKHLSTVSEKFDKEWYIRAREKSGKSYWKRKAVDLLENVLGRKLSRAECAHIAYIDGNLENCVVSNLMIKDQLKKLVSCCDCGAIRIAEPNRSGDQKGEYPKRCLRCSTRFNNFSRKLSLGT